MGTLITLGVTLIVPMPMEDILIAQFFPSTEASRKQMIDLYPILIGKEQSTPPAFSLLFSEEQAQRSTHQVVTFEPLTPVQQVAIIRAGSSFHFGVSLDGRLGVFPQL